jgi:hypothetical protein
VDERAAFGLEHLSEAVLLRLEELVEADLETRARLTTSSTDVTV